MHRARLLRAASLVMLLCSLIACAASDREPAKTLLEAATSVVDAASVDAQKYLPESVAPLQGRLDTLQHRFEQRDYAAVIAEAPRLIDAAHQLAAAAAERKAAATQRWEAEWTALAARYPEDMMAARARLDARPGKASAVGRPAADVSMRLARAAALWSKAQAAFAAGNLGEAVDIAAQADGALQGL